MKPNTIENVEYENGTSVLNGRIKTINVDTSFILIPRDKVNGDGPTHDIIYIDGDTGEMIDVGVGWKRFVKNGNYTGCPSFNLKFTDPDLPEWMENIFAHATDKDMKNPLKIIRNRVRQDKKAV